MQNAGAVANVCRMQNFTVAGALQNYLKMLESMLHCVAGLDLMGQGNKTSKSVVNITIST